jgi:hypothetical protein
MFPFPAKSLLLLLFAAFLLASSLYSAECPLERHSTDPQELEKQMDAMWNRGFAPVGMEMIRNGKDAGAWVLYTQREGSEYRAWSLVEYDSEKDLEADLNRALKDGWTPFDLSLDGDRAWVLYLRLENDADGWKIDSARDMKELENDIRKRAEEDSIPVGLSTDENDDIHALFLHIPGHDISEWKIQSYADIPSMEKDLDTLTSQGWQPYGFMLRERKLHVLLLK